MYTDTMTHSTKPRRRIRRRRRTRKIIIDPACWGKNKPLEQWWNDLSSFLSVVIIYKGVRPYEVIKLHPSTPSAEQFYAQMKPFDDDPNVVAILTAYPDNPDNPDTTNAYETLVYPKAKDKTVDYVITHYDKVFKRAPSHMQKRFTVPLKKVRVPYSFK
jgi:hypothetical protein